MRSAAKKSNKSKTKTCRAITLYVYDYKRTILRVSNHSLFGLNNSNTPRSILYIYISALSVYKLFRARLSNYSNPVILALDSINIPRRNLRDGFLIKAKKKKAYIILLYACTSEQIKWKWKSTTAHCWVVDFITCWSKKKNLIKNIIIIYYL